MQTLTIKIDDNYFNQVINFLQQIPKNKREVFFHQKMDINAEKKRNTFLKILEQGPTLSKDELSKWEQDIKNGYKSWKIEEF